LYNDEMLKSFVSRGALSSIPEEEEEEELN
jgi:hypothetical protein